MQIFVREEDQRPHHLANLSWMERLYVYRVEREKEGS